MYTFEYWNFWCSVWGDPWPPHATGVLHQETGLIGMKILSCTMEWVPSPPHVLQVHNELLHNLELLDIVDPVTKHFLQCHFHCSSLPLPGVTLRINVLYLYFE